MSTTKGSTRMILIHVQKMDKTCTEDGQNMYRRWTKHVQKMCNIFRILIEVLLSMPRLGGVKINVWVGP